MLATCGDPARHGARTSNGLATEHDLHVAQQCCLPGLLEPLDSMWKANTQCYVATVCYVTTQRSTDVPAKSGELTLHSVLETNRLVARN
jgi:hypothetical protein